MDSPAAFARLSMFSLYSAVLPFWKMATAIAPPIKRGRKTPMRSTGKNLREPEWWVDHERCQNNKRWGLQGHEPPHKSLNLGSVPTTSNNCHLGLRWSKMSKEAASRGNQLRFSSFCCGCVPCFAIFIHLWCQRTPLVYLWHLILFFPHGCNSRVALQNAVGLQNGQARKLWIWAWWVLRWLSWHDLMWFVAEWSTYIVYSSFSMGSAMVYTLQNGTSDEGYLTKSPR